MKNVYAKYFTTVRSINKKINTTSLNVLESPGQKLKLLVPTLKVIYAK